MTSGGFSPHRPRHRLRILNDLMGKQI